MRIHKVDQEIPKHKQVGVGDDRIESILHEGFEPSPEKPFHSRHNEKGNKDWAQEDGDGRGYVPKRDPAEDRRLSNQEAQNRDGITKDLKNVERKSQPRRFHAPVEAGEPVPDFLDQRMVQLVRKSQPLIDDE